MQNNTTKKSDKSLNMLSDKQILIPIAAFLLAVFSI